MTERDLIFVGKVTRPHGVRGELRVLEGRGSSGAWRAARQVLLGRSARGATVWRVLRVRGAGRFALLALEGVADRDAAEALREQKVFVDRSALPAPEPDARYAADLVGLRVEMRGGRCLGTLREIFDNGAHEVYVVADGWREVLLPAIAEVVLEVDPAGGRIVVDPPPGLPGLEP